MVHWRDVSRFRLRHGNHEMPLHDGDLVIGRSAATDLPLDDVLVSRRHVVIRISGDRAWIEDLGSRNGVLVNDMPLEGTATLSHRDRIRVGNQTLLFIDAQLRRSGGTVTRESHPASLRKSLLSYEDKARTGVIGEKARELTVLTQLLRQALTTDDVVEAEQQAEKLCQRIEEAGDDVELIDAAIASVTHYLLDLARRLRDERWIARVISLHHDRARLLDSDCISTLHDVVKEVGFADLDGYRAYVGVVRDAAEGQGLRGKVILKRLEGLAQAIEGSRSTTR